MLRKCSGGTRKIIRDLFLEFFRNKSENAPEKIRELSGNVPDCSEKFPEMFRKASGKKFRNKNPQNDLLRAIPTSEVEWHLNLTSVSDMSVWIPNCHMYKRKWNSTLLVWSSLCAFAKCPNLLFYRCECSAILKWRLKAPKLKQKQNSLSS